jgi:hypothetical protein
MTGSCTCNDYGYFTILGNAGVTVANNADFPFSNITTAGGITYSSPTVTIGNAGVYYVSFGYYTQQNTYSIAPQYMAAPNISGSNFFQYGIFTNGSLYTNSPTGVQAGYGPQYTLNSASFISSFTAGQTLTIRNDSPFGNSIIINTGNGSLGAYLTVLRLL